MADTEEGEAIRQYFIETEKKWRMVEEQQPENAKDIESQKEQIEQRKLELQLELVKTNERYFDKRKSVAEMHGKPFLALIDGNSDAVVEIEKPTLEVVDERHNVSFKGQTLNQLRKEIGKRSRKNSISS